MFIATCPVGGGLVRNKQSRLIVEAHILVPYCGEVLFQYLIYYWRTWDNSSVSGLPDALSDATCRELHRVLSIISATVYSGGEQRVSVCFSSSDPNLCGFATIWTNPGEPLPDWVNSGSASCTEGNNLFKEETKEFGFWPPVRSKLAPFPSTLSCSLSHSHFCLTSGGCLSSATARLLWDGPCLGWTSDFSAFQPRGNVPARWLYCRLLCARLSFNCSIQFRSQLRKSAALCKQHKDL